MAARRPAWLCRALAALFALMCVRVVADDLGDAVSRVRELRADSEAARVAGEVAYATAVRQAHVQHEERVAAVEARLRQEHGVDESSRRESESEAEYTARIAAYWQGLQAFNVAWNDARQALARRRDATAAAAEAARDGDARLASLQREIEEIESATYAVEVAARVGSYRHEDASFAVALSVERWPVPTDASVAVPVEQAAAARATFGAVTVEYGIERGEVVRRAMWIGRDGRGDRYRVLPAVWTRAHRLAGHAGPVTGAALVEGHRAVTAGQDGRLLVWNVLDPGEPPREIEAHTQPIQFLAHAEGAIQVASATAHEVKLWNPFTLEPSQTIDPAAALGHRPEPSEDTSPSAPTENASVRVPGPTVSAVAVSSHTPLMAFAVHGPGATVVIWDGSARATAALIDVGESVTESLAFSGCGSVLAAGLRDGRVLLWDVRRKATGTKPGALRQMEVPPIHDGESEGDHRLRTLRLNVAVNATLRRTIAAHRKPVLALAFTPKAKTLVTGSADRTAAAWDAKSGERLPRFAKGHRGAVTSVAIHRKGVRVITGCRDGRARAWEMSTGEQVRNYRGHEGAVRAVAVGARLLTASEDGSARLWWPGTGEQLNLLLGHVSPAQLVGISRDGSRALTRAPSGEVALWDTLAGGRVWDLPAGSNERGAIALSSDGRLVASEGAGDTPADEAGDGVVRVWDVVQGGEAIGSFVSSEGYRIALRFVDDDSRLLVTPTAHTWPVLRDVEKLAETVPVVPRAGTGPLYGAQVSGGGGTVFSLAGRRVRVWDAQRGETRATWLLSDGVDAPTLVNHDGSRLMSYGLRDRVRLWDAATGEMLEELAAATAGATAAAFSHDGEMLVTGSNTRYTVEPNGPTVRHRSPGVVKLWSAQSGRELRSLPTQGDWVGHAVFSGDDRRVVVGAGGSVRVYDVASGNEVAAVGPYESRVVGVRVSHDGATVVVITRKGLLEMWRPVPAPVEATAAASE